VRKLSRTARLTHRQLLDRGGRGDADAPDRVDATALGSTILIEVSLVGGTASPATANGIYLGPWWGGYAPSRLAWPEAASGIDYEWILDFGSNGTMAEIANTGEYAAAIKYYAPNKKVMLSVPMNTWANPLSEIAAGTHDSIFSTIASRCVEVGATDTIMRIGWEFNAGWYAWGNQTAADFIAAWQRIVTLMRAVPGQNFKFFWCIVQGNYNPTPYYPGDAYVDYIGADMYGQWWSPDHYDPFGAQGLTHQQMWEREILGYDQTVGGLYDVAYSTGKQPYCLHYVANMAHIHDKQIAFGEWATVFRPDQGTPDHGFGDSATFINNMHQWFADHNVAVACYWDVAASDCQGRTSFSSTISSVVSADANDEKPLAAAAYLNKFGRPLNSTAPILFESITIAGTLTLGSEQNANLSPEPRPADPEKNGRWVGGVASIARQWQRSADSLSWSDIAAATALTYTLVADDMDGYIRFREIATNPIGSTTAYSQVRAISASSGNIVTNGEFGVDTTGWQGYYNTLGVRDDTRISAVGGRLRVTADTAKPWVTGYYEVTGLTAGVDYEFSTDYVRPGADSGTRVTLSIQGVGNILDTYPAAASGTVTHTFTATASTQMSVYLWAYTDVVGAYSEYDNVSVVAV
jgi:hypothetical protein